MEELSSMTQKQRSEWLCKLVRAIRALERSCLSKDHTPTTIKYVKEIGFTETRSYYRWLRQQAPGTAMGYDDEWTMFVDALHPNE